MTEIEIERCEMLISWIEGDLKTIRSTLKDCYVDKVISPKLALRFVDRSQAFLKSIEKVLTSCASRGPISEP